MRLRPGLAAAGLALTIAAAAPDGDFMKSLQEWRDSRDKRLRSENGWLTLVGLHWLSPGENGFGSDPALPVPLAAGKAPSRAGTFTLDGDTVKVHAEQSGLTKEGRPVTDDSITIAEPDGDAVPYKLGDLTLLVIRRSGRFAIRVKDPNSPVRLAFKGIESFQADPALRVEGDWVAYDKAKEVPIATVLGTVDKMQAPGYVKFRLQGQELTLEPVVEDPSDPSLFFIFKDQTSGKETYPAGRFLYASMPSGGKVVLDFNRAYNPPCAFTPYATCPLPPKRNWLPVRIEAGEKTFGHEPGRP